MSGCASYAVTSIQVIGALPLALDLRTHSTDCTALQVFGHVRDS